MKDSVLTLRLTSVDKTKLELLAQADSHSLTGEAQRLIRRAYCETFGEVDLATAQVEAQRRSGAPS